MTILLQHWQVHSLNDWEPGKRSEGGQQSMLLGTSVALSMYSEPWWVIVVTTQGLCHPVTLPSAGHHWCTLTFQRGPPCRPLDRKHPSSWSWSLHHITVLKLGHIPWTKGKIIVHFLVTSEEPPSAQYENCQKIESVCPILSITKGQMLTTKFIKWVDAHLLVEHA